MFCETGGGQLGLHLGVDVSVKGGWDVRSRSAGGSLLEVAGVTRVAAAAKAQIICLSLARG